MKRLILLAVLFAGCQELEVRNNFTLDDAQQIVNEVKCVTSHKGVCMCVWRSSWSSVGGITIDPTSRACQ